MLNIVIIGSPASGKGSQSKKLAADPDFKNRPDSSGLIHISTGDLLRKEMENATPLGLSITETMNRGEYVSNEFASQLLMNKTQELGGYRVDGFIFDGFPRTLPQCIFLDKHLEKFKAEVNVVINLMVPSPVLIERILERGKTSGREDDKTKAGAVKRLKVFADETLPCLEFYRNKGIVIDVDGVGTQDEVYNRIVKALTGESEN